MFGFKKQTLSEKRSARRKKYLQEMISRLTERKAILEIQVETVEKDLEKYKQDLKNVLRKE